ncbi:MAG: ribonuclease H-like YkuK family protein [Firmicutes bacterium]|nr:ribonuclease H-like YkuK family protein [Bacillota bacterium]
MQLISPTKGRMSFEETMADIRSYITGLPTSQYKIIIGTDSQITRGETCFITAIIVHRLGKGARYYYRRHTHRKLKSLRQRIFYETALSLELGSMVSREFAESGAADLKVEIHIDVGHNGETRDLIREVVGMVVGSGFKARIKPEAYGASAVADKHTK